MDIANPTIGIRKRRRLKLMAGGASLVLVSLACLAWRLDPALPVADRSSLWIDAVQQGDMLREVRATGSLAPREIRWLAAATPAQVEQILVWPGTPVQPDTVLIRLSDPAVEDALRNAQAQVAAAQAEVAAKRAELESQLLDQRSALAQAHPDQLEQALINLLRNAVEASLPQGGVRLRWARDGERACIEVEDDGPGPPPSDNLFVPFFTTKPGGSGIGLALTRQIAEAHEGGVALVAREDARGAVARLWLPLSSDPSASRAP